MTAGALLHASQTQRRQDNEAAALPAWRNALVAALSGYYLERAQAHGCALDDAAVLRLLEMDIELNAQGLEVWLDRARR